MGRTQRSPPAKTTPNNELLQVSSDADTLQSLSSGLDTSQNVNTAPRYRRPCDESPPPSGSNVLENEVASLKRELLEMLTKWKNEQDEKLTLLANEQSSSIAKLAKELAQIKLQYIEIQKSNAEIEKNVAFISQQYDDMLQQIDVLKKDKQTYRDSILHLDTKMQDLQQLSRPSSIEIRNVPPADNETSSDLSKIVSNLGAAVDLSITDSTIRDVYRLPGKPGTIRPIVTEFTNVQIKNQLITSVRNFNKRMPNEERLNSNTIGVPGDRRPVYIAEFLPASSRKLLYSAREFAKAREYKFCWTTNGNIFLRKIEGAKSVHIKSEKTLMELQLNQ